jgi:hypothetical protein
MLRTEWMLGLGQLLETLPKRHQRAPVRPLDPFGAKRDERFRDLPTREYRAANADRDDQRNRERRRGGQDCSGAHRRADEGGERGHGENQARLSAGRLGHAPSLVRCSSAARHFSLVPALRRRKDGAAGGEER